MSKFNNLVCILLSCLKLEIFADSKIHFSDSVSAFLSKFKTCHFKLIGIGTNQFIHQNNLASSTLHQLTNTLSSSLTVTLSTESVEISNISNFNLFAYNHHQFRRYSLCFVHLYLVPIFENFLEPKNQSILVSIKTNLKMQEYESFGETPDYFVFLQDFQHEVINYSQFLKNTFVTGPVFLIIEYSSVRLVDVSLIENNGSGSFTLLNPLDSLQNIRKNWHVLHSNFHGVFVNTGWNRKVIEYAQILNCNILAGKARATWYAPVPSMCIHKLLSNALNYSYDRLVANSNFGEQTDSLVASGGIYICEDNYIVMKSHKMNREEWVPHSVEFRKFQFVSIKRKSGFLADALIEPLDFVTWIFLFLSSCLLVLVTYYTGNSYFMLYKGKPFALSDISINLFATVVEQSVPQKLKMWKTYKTNMILICWAIWCLMISNASNLYKGAIFSYLTTSVEPAWPKNVHDLVFTPDLKLFTFVGGTSGNRSFSIFQEEYLDCLNQLEYTEELQKLNKSLVLYKGDWLNFTLQVFALNENVKSGKVLPNVVSSTNFAFIEHQGIVEVLSMMIRILTPLNTASQPVTIPGYTHITPWQVSRNYIYPAFVRGLASLFESGIVNELMKISKQVFRRYALYQMYSQMLKLNWTDKSFGGGISRNKIYYQSIFYNQLRFHHDSASKLTMQMVGTVFVLYGILLSVATMVIFFERENLKTKM